jgi:AAA+ superfamily predicted ATPase
MGQGTLPAWAQQLRELFLSGSVSQFILYGNVFDLVPCTMPDGSRQFLSLKKFLDEVMLDTYDTVIHYDRGKGIRVPKGDREWSEWINSIGGSTGQAVPRDPLRALELIDLFLLRTLNLQAIRSKEGKPFRVKQAVILDFAQFVVPRGDPVQLSGDISSNIVKILSWGSEPAILSSNIVSILIAEKLNDLSTLVAENPHAAKIEIKLPDEPEMLGYLGWLKSAALQELEERSDVPMDLMAKRLTGLSKIDAGNILSFAVHNDRRVTEQLLRAQKKEMIEKQCQDLLEFLESGYNLDIVAGLEAAKQWLRQDASLLKRGKTYALPMGYLISGRIGTGKTFLVECWAGELGIPCVVLKNFRDKWVGATESNLEKIFSILRALGQVVVFVDEADQMTGKREGGSGDSGLSGRVYAMLAKEMSDTRNRGRIIWVFATSRPDLLEVDLKRQGRLDVHIPLFPPQTEEEYRQLFFAISRKIKFPLKAEDLPTLPKGCTLGGNEIEGLLVRALRIYELQSGEEKQPLSGILAHVVRDMKPSAHTRKLEYMDLVAVRECTDAGFLPERFAAIVPEELESRIDELRRFM